MATVGLPATIIRSGTSRVTTESFRHQFGWHGYDAKATKYLIFNNYAARNIGATFAVKQDRRCGLDIEIRAYNTTLANSRFFANEYKLSNTSSFADIDIVENGTVLSVTYGH